MFQVETWVVLSLVVAASIATVIGLQKGGISRPGRGRGADRALNALLVLLAIGIAAAMVWMLLRD
jgi:hypothetical protein